MKTAVVIGAGATLAEALPMRPSRSERPPLDATFFELCRVKRLRPQAPVRDYMKAHFGIDPFDSDWRMEEVFNFIYSDTFSSAPPDGCLDAYWALVQLYSEAVGKTTDELTGTSRGGVGAVLRHLWRCDSGCDLSFVTFNQDLVIEKAIDAAAATKTFSDIPWSLQAAYGMAFSRMPRLGASHFADADTGSVRVLKLHGSLNWVYKVRSGTDPKNSIRSPKTDLICINSKEVLTRLRTKTNKRWIPLIPLVVPPIYEKSARYQEVVGPVWSAAAQVISECERLIVFGYSFPDTDYAAKTLFKRAFYENPGLQDVYVVDTDPGVPCKLSRFLEPKACHHYTSVSAMMADTRERWSVAKPN